VVNYYFAGKRDLLLQSFNAFLESYYHQIADLIYPDSTAGEMLEIVISVCFPEKNVALPLWKYDPKIYAENLPEIDKDPVFSIDRLGKVLVHFIAKTILDDDFQAIHQKVYRAYLEGMRTIIQQGVAFGEFRDVEPDEAAFSIMAMIEGMVLYRNIGFNPKAPQDYRAACLNFARRYLTPN
jgi:AcrR family transcriptional regulator